MTKIELTPADEAGVISRRELRVPERADIGAWDLERVVLVNEFQPDEHLRVYVGKTFGKRRTLELRRDKRGKLQGPFGFFLSEGGETVMLHRVLDRMLAEQRSVIIAKAEATLKRRQRPSKKERDQHVRR